MRAPADPAAIVELCIHSRPCVVVIDEGSAASGLLRQLSRKGSLRDDVWVLVRQQRPDDCAVMNLVRCGCHGILGRHITGEQLQKAAESVSHGEYWLSRGQMSRLLQHLLCQSQSGLTPREEQVWSCIARNLTNRQIAEDLWISAETVRWHIRRLGRRLGVSGRDELARLWHGRGMRPQQPDETSA